MPDSEHSVVYRATADFTNLAIEARKARAELKGLTDDEISANQKTAEAAERAAVRKVKATDSERAALKARNTAEIQAYKDREALAKRSIDASKDAETQAYKVREANAKRSLKSVTDAEILAYKIREENEKKSLNAVKSAESRAYIDRETLIRVEVVKVAQAAKAKAAAEKKEATDLDNFFKDFAKKRVQYVKDNERAEKESATKVDSFLKDFSKRRVQYVKDVAAEEAKVTKATKDQQMFFDSMARKSTAFNRTRGGSSPIGGIDFKSVARDLGQAEKEMVRFGRASSGLRRDVEHTSSAFSRFRAELRSLPRGGFFDSLGKGADRLSGLVGGIVQAFAHLGRTLKGLGIFSLIAALGPLISALSSLGGLAIGVASSLGSLAGAVGALPGLFLAAASGIGALVVAFAPFMGALKAYFNVQKQAGQAAGDSGAQQRTSARQIRDASRQVADAERTLAKAHERVTEAQIALNKARKEALRDLIDLREEVARGSLDEEGAVLALARAQEDYRKSLADPTQSLLDRQQAVLDVKNAEWDLHDVQTKNTENADKLAEAEKAGVEGSEKVISAKKDVIEANEGVQQAEEGVQRALESLADAQVQATEGSKALNHAQDALAAAMAKLSPSARAFLEGLLGMADGFKAIRDNVQEGFFGPLVGELDNIKGFLPTINTLLSDAAGALGRVAARGIEMITSGPWKADFATLSKSNIVIIENLGDAALLVADAFRHIAIAAKPFTEWISVAIKGMAASFRDWAKAGRESGSLTKFFDDLRERMQLVGRIIKNLLVTFLNFGKAATPFGDDMLRAFEKITKGWSEFSEKQTKDGSKFKKWLEDTKPILHEWALLIKAIADGVVKISIDPNNLKFAADLLHKLATDTVPRLVSLIDAIGKTPFFESFLDALNSALDGLSSFINGGGGGGILTFFKVIGGVLKLIVDSGAAKVFGVIAIGLGALAAVSVVGKFLGIFKLFRGFAWMLKNAKGITGAFAALLKGGGVAGAKSALSSSGVGNSNFNPQITQTNTTLSEILLAIRTGGLTGKAGAAGTAATTAAGTAGTAASTAASSGSLLSRLLLGAGRILGPVGGALAQGAVITGGVEKIASGEKLKASDIPDPLFLNASIKALRAAFGETTVGKWVDKNIVTPVDDFLTNTLPKKIRSLFSGLGDLVKDYVLQPTIDFFNLISDKIGEGASAVGDFVVTYILQPTIDFFNWIAETIVNAPGAIGNFVVDYILQPTIDFFNCIAQNISSAASAVGDFVVTYILRPTIDFFNWIATTIANAPGAIGDFVVTYILRPTIDFFNWIARSISAGASAVGNFVVDYILQPTVDFFRWIGAQISNAPGAIGDLIYNYVLTPLGHLFQGIGNALKTALKWIINQLPIPGPVKAGIVSALGLRKGGKVPEGVSVVGEEAPEFLVKRGSQIDVVPMSNSAFSQLNVVDAPGFAFGTDFGMSALREIRAANQAPFKSNTTNTHANTDHSINVDKIEINNPVQEKAGDSLYRSVQKMRYFAGSGGGNQS